MTENNKKSKDSKDKVELANKIARQSQKVSKTYENLENVLMKFVRFISTTIDKVLFNPKYTILVSLGLAILLFLSMNYSSDNPIINTGTLNSEKTITDVQVYAKYNSETFELVDLPSTMDVFLIGTASNVTSAATKTGRVEVNLEGYTEGTHKVKVTVEGYGNGVEAKPADAEITLTLRKKVTRQFEIGYDYINTDKIDSKYVLGKPEFETTRVNVRASQETLDSIAFVKALINVAGHDTTFEDNAPLVAYDKNGYPVNADITPATVKVKVDMTTPSKEVPIVLETTGVVPDGMAIDNIVMDHQSVTIYAPESVLSKVDKITVSLDASILNKDTKLFVPVILPTGVNSASISKVNLDITLGEIVERTISNVNLSYRNNVGKFKDLVVSQSTVSVKVLGTQTNVDLIDPALITVYFDMTDAKAGTTADYTLQVEYGQNNSYVSFITEPLTVSVTIPESGIE